MENEEWSYDKHYNKFFLNAQAKYIIINICKTIKYVIIAVSMLKKTVYYTPPVMTCPNMTWIIQDLCDDIAGNAAGNLETSN